MTDLNAELAEAVEELVAAVEATAHCPAHNDDCPKHGLDWDCDETAGQWVVDVHGETDDTHTIEQAADRIEQKLRD